MNLRLRRLTNDYSLIMQYLADNPYIKLINTTGEPPEKYQLEYHLKGIQMMQGMVTGVLIHKVELSLPLEYPTIQPQCRMLSPVFHPNIAPHAICIADHWAAGESLKEVIIRIGEMITYQNYSIKSPLNGEAAKWAHDNQHRLPLDIIDLRAYGIASDVAAPPRAPAQASLIQPSLIQPSLIQPSALQPQPTLPSGTQPANAAPVEKNVPIHVCQSCGNNSEQIKFVRCKSQHIICLDCIIACQCCGKKLCIICGVTRCKLCNKAIGAECKAVCELCSNEMCTSHLRECTVCHQKVCILHFTGNHNICEPCLE